MNFQVIIGIIFFCYLGVEGGPGSGADPLTRLSLGASVDTPFTPRRRPCNCPSGTSSSLVLKPIPFPYLVRIERNDPNVLGYYGEDAVRCTVKCKPRFAKLRVGSDIFAQDLDPLEDRLAVYTTGKWKFCVRRIQFKVKYASQAMIRISDEPGGILNNPFKDGRGVCLGDFPTPTDNKWHWMRCDWCDDGLQQINKLTIEFVSDRKQQVMVKNLQLWNCQ